MYLSIPTEEHHYIVEVQDVWTEILDLNKAEDKATYDVYREGSPVVLDGVGANKDYVFVYVCRTEFGEKTILGSGYTVAYLLNESGKTIQKV